MQLGKFVVVMAVLAGFMGAPVSRAFAEGRNPAAADSSGKHKKKKKKKSAKKAKKSKSHKSAHHASKKHSGASGASAGTHYPTQPGGTGGFDNIPAEKKDDLPPPQTPAN